jgi:hypothetical protein
LARLRRAASPAGRHSRPARRRAAAVAADAVSGRSGGKRFTVRWRFGEAFARYMEQDDRQFGRIIALLPAETSCMH